MQENDVAQIEEPSRELAEAMGRLSSAAGAAEFYIATAAGLLIGNFMFGFRLYKASNNTTLLWKVLHVATASHPTEKVAELRAVMKQLDQAFQGRGNVMHATITTQAGSDVVRLAKLGIPSEASGKTIPEIDALTKSFHELGPQLFTLAVGLAPPDTMKGVSVPNS